ncbi:Glycosyl transferase, group 2 family [hydrothermal vent metagenome]|uniref:Glycosyl transferase, group 2 family n=1 Tax=hydrothermal vent metagenome TaxID=652676 RepID=A0A3B1D9I7_9ZZZZ
MIFISGIIAALLWTAIFLIVYSYLLYPLLLVFLNKFHKPVESVLSSQLPNVSIIIAAYNEETVISQRVKNCLALDYPREQLEIIIASDGSDDQTNELVRKFEDQGVILFDYKERRGKVNVLNDTVPRAKHEILVFSDANTDFEKDALKKLVRHFQEPDIGCVCGQLKFVNALGSKTGELEGVYWRFETLLKKMEGNRGSLLGANGAIYAIRKSLFVFCPPDTIIEDFVIPMKILEEGHRVVYEPKALAIEEAAKHIVQEKKRRIRIGAGDFQSLALLKPLLNPKRGFSALAFWSHKVLRWFAPFFIIIAFITNIFLLSNPYYQVLFLLQCIFYISAFIGQVLNWAGVQIKFFSLCYYFISMNISLFLGFVRFVTGTQKVAWERTER